MYERGYDVVQTPDSGFLVTGFSGSFSTGHSDAFLLKVDKNGNNIWSQSYGGVENDAAFALKRIDNFGVYLLGRTTGADGDFDAWVTLVNDMGDEIWSRSYPGDNWEEIVDAALTQDSGLIVGVSTFGSSAEGTDIMLMRLNANGDTVWTQTAFNAGDDELTNIEPYQDSLFIVSSNHLDEASQSYYGCLRMMHEDGTLIWSDTVAVDSAGSLFLNDFYIEQDTVFAVGAYRINDTSLFDLMQYKHWIPLGSSGELELTYGNSFRNIEGQCIAPVVGTPFKYVSYTVENPIGGSLVVNKNFVIGLSNNLSIVSVAGETLTEGDDLLINGYSTADSGAVFVGYQTLENGTTAIAVAKLGPNFDYPTIMGVTSVNQLVGNEEVFEEFEVSIFPNPCTSEITIQLDSSPINVFAIRNLQGKIVSKGALTLGKTTIPIAGLAPGMYMVELLQSRVRMGSKRIIVQ